MKKTVIFGVLGFIGIVISVVLLLSTGTESLLLSLRNVSLPALVIFTLLSIANFVIFSFKWQLILRTNEKHTPSLYKLTMFRLVAYAISYIVPSAQVGGEPARIYLTEQTGVKRETVLSSIIIDKVFEVSINSIGALIACILLFLNHAAFKSTGVLMIVAVIVLLIGFFWHIVQGKDFFIILFRTLHLHRISALATFEQTIIRTEKTIHDFFQHHPTALINTLVLSVICFFMMLVEYVVIFYFFGITPTWSQLLIVTIIPLISYLIPIPGAAGTLEIAQISAFTMAGINPILALPTIIIIRIRDIIFVVGGLLYGYGAGISIIRNTQSSIKK